MKQKSFKIQTVAPWPLVMGLDISDSNIKYVLLNMKGKSPRVESFGKYAMKEGQNPQEKLQYVLNRLFAKGSEGRKAQVILGLEGGQVIINRESFPSLSKKELEQMITFSVQKEASASGEVSETVSNYIKLGPSQEKPEEVEFLIMGAPEYWIEEKVFPLNQVGIIPAKISPNLTSLVNLSHYLPHDQQTALTGILDIGAKRSMLILTRNNRLEFYREIVVGGDDFTRGITGTIFHEGRAIQFTTDEATEFKLKFGYPLGYADGMTFHGAPLGEVGTMMRPVVERLTGEIQRSIDFFQDKTEGLEVDALYLVGGGALLKHLPEVLEEKLNRSVKLFTLPKEMKVSGDPKQQRFFEKRFPQHAISFALALENSTEGSLLTQSYEKARLAKKVQKWIAYAAAGVAGLLLLITLSMQGRVASLQSKVKREEARVAKEIDKRLSPEFFDAISRQRNALVAKQAELQGVAGQDEHKIQILRLISHSVPSTLSLISMDYIRESDELQNAPKKQRNRSTDADTQEAPPDVLKIYGMSAKPPNDVGVYLGQFIVELIKSGYFTNVEVEKDMVLEDTGEYHFMVTASLKQEGA